MSNEVYANGMEVSCKAAAGKSIAAFPDVCFTPPLTPATPPGVPIPYPNTGMASDTSGGSKTVQISGKEVMMKDSSYFKTSTGDEAGSAPKKNVITSVIQGKCYYTAWSMDVKVEGENAVRHLDLMTHNHASNPGATPPWPYMDEVAMKDANHPCAKSGDKKKVKDNCTAPPEDCNTADCCNARKCMLVPAALDDANNKCKGCKRSGKKLTPHHIIPIKDHQITEGGARTGDIKDNLIHGCKTYDGDKAPGICASGHDHGAEEASGRLKQHGRIGRAYVHMRNSLAGDTYKYEDVAAPAAEIVGHHVGCDPACIKEQMDDYHTKSSKGNLRKSKQAEVRGKQYYEEAIPDDSMFFSPA